MNNCMDNQPPYLPPRRKTFLDKISPWTFVASLFLIILGSVGLQMSGWGECFTDDLSCERTVIYIGYIAPVLLVVGITLIPILLTIMTIALIQRKKYESQVVGYRIERMALDRVVIVWGFVTLGLTIALLIGLRVSNLVCPSGCEGIWGDYAAFVFMPLSPLIWLSLTLLVVCMLVSLCIHLAKKDWHEAGLQLLGIVSIPAIFYLGTLIVF